MKEKQEKLKMWVEDLQEMGINADLESSIVGFFQAYTYKALFT